MINGIETRVKIQQVLENQIPEFLLEENPKFIEFLKQYYISQEYQGGPVDISENLDQYLKLDNLIPEVISSDSTLMDDITENDTVINVDSTKGYPEKYGIFKIDDEIITYKSKTTNSFVDCIRGFSGITDYHQNLNQEELVFSTSNQSEHYKNTKLENVSSLFLREIYKKIKYTLTPGLEDYEFTPELNVGNFIKESRSLYSSKGTDESFKILFNVLYGVTPKIIDLEQFLIKPSNSQYLRRELVIVESIGGDPYQLKGQSIFRKNDSTSSASVSEVEILTKNGKTYYKLFLFVGYDDTYPSITGSFTVTPSSKVLEKVTVGSKVISVDSTISFPEFGEIYYENNKINYKKKTVNQFLDCYTDNDSSIQVEIPISSLIRSNDVYYGYENGNLNKEVQFRITGVISDLNVDKNNNTYKFSEGDELFVKSIGEKIQNPIENKSRKEIIANSFIYNTSCSFELNPIQDGKLLTKSSIDKSSLKVNDYAELVKKGSGEVVLTSIVETITKSIDPLDQTDIYQINLKDPTNPFNETKIEGQPSDYKLRRKLDKASSSIVPIEFGNDEIISNIQNVYNENDEYLYIASNSLPSFEIDVESFRYKVSQIDIASYNPTTKKYSILKFDDIVSFITGDQVYYTYSDTNIEYLEEGIYYVEVLSDKKSIRLYTSSSFIESGGYFEFGNSSNSGSLPNGDHIIILGSQKENLISPQKALKKLKINPKYQNNQNYQTIPGKTGIMVNGVEILNYKSLDKIYYGPLKEINVLSGGSGYDVVNPPLLKVSSGIASVQPVVQGFVEKVFVDPYEFDIDIVANITITGGNGKGAVFKPVISKKRKELLFDARNIDAGGGLDIVYETITFIKDHNLQGGEPLTYKSNGNIEIGITTTNTANNSNQNANLINDTIYYPKVVNNKTIQLFKNTIDYAAGINTVRFTSVGNSGFHIFETTKKNILTDIKVINSGSGFTNRKLIVNPVGISTINSLVNFKNHGFSNGDLVVYSYENSSISGLTTTNQYYILKIDNDNFKLCDAGIGGTITSNFDRNKFVKFNSTGSGYQIFNYPEISVSIEYTTVGIGSTQLVGKINAQPIVRGEIISAYLYEKGSDYGSTALNLHKSPSIIVKNGEGAQLKPLISNGRIIDVIVLYGGSNYYSTPDLVINGTGVDASLKPVIKNNKIVDVIVLDSGIGYDSNTSITAVPAGKNAIFDVKVRDLTVNSSYKFGNQISGSYREPASEIVLESDNNLGYCVLSYSEKLADYFNDSSKKHSPIIGWAYDGNPIYGPYGYSIPNDPNSIKLLSSGYSDVTVENRPSTSLFPKGFFVEDYAYTNDGDLDVYNGRYCITPEFPQGTYAYFSTLEFDDTGKRLVGSFPYFIGSGYRSEFIDDNLKLNQDFNFNNSNLIRNTFPYKISDQYADNDFIIESNELVNQKVIIESTSQGSIEGFDIIEGGDKYKVGDSLKFIENDSYGGGLRAEVSEVKGIDINSVSTTIETYDQSIVTWDTKNQIKVKISPYHTFNSGDNVNIYNSSEDLSYLNGQHSIYFSEKSSNLFKKINSSNGSGIVTDIVLSYIPDNISIGSSIKINNEYFSILNLYKQPNALKVLRSSVGTSHSEGDVVKFLPDYFVFDQKTDYFESEVDDKMYFNPTVAVGLGTTTGYGQLKTYLISDTEYKIFVPTQSIYLPNHKFKTSQKVILRNYGGNPISISTTPNGVTSNLLSGSSDVVYVINKSKDFIGIVTNIGLTTNTSGLYFRSFVPTGYADNLYSIESVKDKKTAKVVKINSTVSVSTSHNLSENDYVKLNIHPNLTVGIGTSSLIDVKYDAKTNSILCGKILFNSSAVNSTLDVINLKSHKLMSGDRVYYNSSTTIASGLSTGIYYVYKVDDDSIKLCETKNDTLQSPPITVNITSSGGNNQELRLVRPQIKTVRDNNLKFNLSDSSLLGYKFKFYYDNDLTKEFVSSQSGTNFNIVQTGTVGILTSLLTLNYSENIPDKLFYSLEKNGDSIFSNLNTEPEHSGEIVFVDSVYNGNYFVHGIGNTTFNISLTAIPENLDYTRDQCNVIEYKTKSKTASGAIENIKILSKGSNYKKLPSFYGSDSKTGIGAYVIPKSSSVGKINQIRFANDGFEYSSDKTLRPKVLVPEIIKIKSTNIIGSIQVISPGKNYTKSPDLILVDYETGKKIDSGFLEANFSGSSILSVNIVEMPKGLPSTLVEIKAINNTNGIFIQEVSSSPSGTVSCTLLTPLSGSFAGNIEPFKVGDKIYVENIEKVGTDGDGFNSEDYGYKFFTVKNYYTTNPRVLEYSLSGFTTNPGIAKTIPSTFPSVINYDNYPLFEVKQVFSPFYIGESILVHNGLAYIDTDIIVKESNENYLKIVGKYILVKGNVIKGKQSGNIAVVESINEIDGLFEINFSVKKQYGWKEDNGKLNDSYQVISDNDYYQNSSYTIKSEKTWEEIITPVNNLVHATGMKNFADTEIIKNVSAGITEVADTNLSLINNFISESRVDTINNFDLVIDKDIFYDKSKLLQFKNVKLSNYFLAKTNRVLEIDDISQRFSTPENYLRYYSNIFVLDDSKTFHNFLIQVRNLKNTEVEIVDLVVLIDPINRNLFNLQKGSLSNTKNSFVDIYGVYEEFTDSFYLKFDPIDILNTDYDIKILNSEFVTNNITQSNYEIGIANLIGVNTSIIPNDTKAILKIDSKKYNSLYTTLEITSYNNQKEYAEIYIAHNNTDIFSSEYYFDTTTQNGSSSGFLGTFTSSLNSGILTLNYKNLHNKPVIIRSKTVGIATTSSIITSDVNYRFKLEGQLNGTERTALYNSSFLNITSQSVILTLDKDLFSSLKSFIRIKFNGQIYLHQILATHLNDDSYIEQYPFLSTGDRSGIGTFAAEISGNNFNIKFYPDAGISGTIEVSSFNQLFYTQLDVINGADILDYTPVQESFSIRNFYGKNSDNVNTSDFELLYNGSAIFKKTFNPSNSLTLSTGNFNIPNHFFVTGEQLIYKPNSSFIGIAASAIEIKVGITSLPETVYAIKQDNDNLKLALSQSDALSGISITFSSYGSGNAHELEMFKKDEKAIISINDLIQYPLLFSNITHKLQGNIVPDQKILHLSGISTVSLRDLLRIDNEYVKVVNVGFGTSSLGPITFSGSYPLVEVERGFVGSSATSHALLSNVKLYKGSFNIEGNRIYFTESPIGLPEIGFTGLPRESATFNGRVFLRSDYASNIIFDDISKNFTGVGQTYKLSANGSSVVGLGTSGGNGIVLVNGIFQSPTTVNNNNNNYRFEEVGSNTNIIFSGIQDSSNNQFTSVSDVNLNQLPRNGLIVSLGSTPGLGYAPLVGASATAIVSPSGTITQIVLSEPGSGYKGPISIGITYSNHTGSNASITATVGAGGTLALSIADGGSGYINPIIQIPPPNYENLSVIGVSRLSIGQTTDTGIGLRINAQVGPSSITAGIGSTLFSVNSFKITRSGYGFKEGDVVKLVGLVTAKGLSNPVEDFLLTITETYTDSFAAWNFGELDYIDSVSRYQDGVRRRFPLYYQSTLLSFEKNVSDQDSNSIDMDSLLLIFVNGVIQKPKEAYQFKGGSSFTFTEAPKVEDNIAIFFYRGIKGVDSYQSDDVIPPLESGDLLQVYNNNNLRQTRPQDIRSIYSINSSDTVETNLYSGNGIDSQNYKPVYWTKKKYDQIINGEILYKSRESIESQIYPTAKIIRNLSSTDTQLFVDDASLFNYEKVPQNQIKFDSLIVSGNPDPVSAKLTPVVSPQGTVTSLNIISGGSGYIGSGLTVRFSSPNGIGSTARATVTVSSAGTITTPITITNSGSGYTTTNLPQVIVPLPDISSELIKNATFVKNYSGVIVGIATTVGIGATLAIKFTLTGSSNYTDLLNCPIFISNTRVGNGVTSITLNDSAVGIGTTFLDNIYYVNAVNSLGIITCNVHSKSTLNGISTTGVSSNPVGRFSVGKISGFTRSGISSVSLTVYGNRVDVGLTTYPTIQRRGVGFRKGGSIKKDKI